MTYVVGGVDRLCHRADGERRNDILLRFALDCGEQLVQLLGCGIALLDWRLEDVAKAENE